MARAYSGCEVWQQDFVHLELPPAVRRHLCQRGAVPRAEPALPTVLGDLYATLKPGGVLFSSNPRGDNQEGWNGPRYGSYHDFDTWQQFMLAAKFSPAASLLPPAKSAARSAALAG